MNTIETKNIKTSQTALGLLRGLHKEIGFLSHVASFFLERKKDKMKFNPVQYKVLELLKLLFFSTLRCPWHDW